jgi:hypothetical protein
MDQRVQIAFDFEPRLEELQRLYKLTPGNLVYAYGILKHRVAGNWEQFLEDYPCDEEMAWRSKGDLFFGSNNISKLLKMTNEIPYQLFMLDRTLLQTGFTSFNDLLAPQDKFDILDRDAPHIVVWEDPRFNREYIVSGDSGAGTVRGDPSSTFVIDKNTGDMMAEFHGLVQPHQHAAIMKSLGKIYNTALLAPEANSIGMSTLNEILRDYPNVYRWRKLDDVTGRLTKAAGWWTSTKTRTLALGLLARIVEEVAREGSEVTSMIKSRGAVNEMRTFVENPERGAPEAAAGCQDDRIMALAIAYFVAGQETKGLKDDILSLLRPATEDEINALQLQRPYESMPVKDVVELIKKNMRLDEYNGEGSLDEIGGYGTAGYDN